MTIHFSPIRIDTTSYPRTLDNGTTALMVEVEGIVGENVKTAPPNIKTPAEKRRVFKRRNRSFLLMSRHNIRSGITSKFREQANPGIQTCFHNGAEKHFRFPAKIYGAPDVPFEIISVPGCTCTDARFKAWTPRSQFRLPVRLPSYFALPEIIDDTGAAAFNRAKIAVYDAEFPQSKFPEHKIFGRASRNGSPQYDAETLKSLREYIDLHGSTEPLQSNFMVGQRSQEMEMRPSPEEMAGIWNDPSIKYEVRTISSAPPLRECGYATPFYSLMKIPVSGAVKYWVTKKNVSEDKLRRRRGNEGKSQENIDSEIKALASFEIVSFKNRGEKWALCSFGGMKFAPFRYTYTKNGRTVMVFRGELTDNGPYAAQDKLVQPQELECPGSDKKFWAPLVPRELSNKALPFDTDSEDELQFGYCYDSRSEPPEHSEPHDDIDPYVILERKQMREPYKGHLAPQSLRVSDSLLGLAKNRTEIGRALSDDQTLDEKTYERRGKLALDETLADIRKVRQILAAQVTPMPVPMPVKSRGSYWNQVAGPVVKVAA